MSYRRSGMGQAITAPVITPGLPLGYDPTTGTVSGNPTGATATPANPYLDVSLMPIDSYFSAQSDIANAPTVYCAGSGCAPGSTAPTGGGTPTNTTWGNLLLIGGGIVLLLFVAKGLVK